MPLDFDHDGDVDLALCTGGEARLYRNDGLDVDLYSSAVGKDHAAWIRAGRAGTGRGVELETLPVGVQIGLDEGVEMHILGLVVGVGTWPPRIKLPLLPGWPYWSAAGAEPMAVPPATVP